MSTMVTVTEPMDGCADREYVCEIEKLAIDDAQGSKDVEACAQGVTPNLSVQGATLQPIVVPTTVRIRLDMESLIKQARNEDEKLAIIAAINRFYLIALLGATDRRCAC
jgi:hypothetical protein